MAIKAIVRRIGCSRKTVRQVLRGERSDLFRCRTSSFEPRLDRLDREWTTRCARLRQCRYDLPLQPFRPAPTLASRLLGVH